MGEGEQNYVFSFGEPDYERVGEEKGRVDGDADHDKRGSVGQPKWGRWEGHAVFVFSVVISIF